MRRTHSTLVPATFAPALLLALLAFAPAARAEGFSVGARAGTTGVGPELAFGLGPHLDARIAGGFGSHSDTFDKTGVHYDAELRLRNVPLLADFHPGGGGFRISAGAAWDDNRLEVSAPLIELVRRERPDLPIPPGLSLGTLSGRAKGDSIAPYLGFGWGSTSGGGRWGVSFDVGALYQGKPDVELTLESRALGIFPPVIQQAVGVMVADEERRLEEELDSYRYYPVVALGIVFRP